VEAYLTGNDWVIQHRPTQTNLKEPKMSNEEKESNQLNDQGVVDQPIDRVRAMRALLSTGEHKYLLDPFGFGDSQVEAKDRQARWVTRVLGLLESSGPETHKAILGDIFATFISKLSNERHYQWALVEMVRQDLNHHLGPILQRLKQNEEQQMGDDFDKTYPCEWAGPIEDPSL
jgi:DNA-binding ferritin-like protein (Dps family)